MHAKFMVIDKETCLIGSYNLDNMSRGLVSESAIVVKSKGLAEELDKQFHEEDLRYARRISYDDALRYHKPRGSSLNNTLQKIKLFMAKQMKPLL